MKIKRKQNTPIRTVTQEDINRGLREAFGGQRQPQRPQYQQREEPRRMTPKQQKLPKLTFEPPQPPEPEPEDEPYWSPEQWEEWAYHMYTNYPELHRYLPQWFVEVLQES